MLTCLKFAPTYLNQIPRTSCISNLKNSWKGLKERPATRVHFLLPQKTFKITLCSCFNFASKKIFSKTWDIFFLSASTSFTIKNECSIVDSNKSILTYLACSERAQTCYTIRDILVQNISVLFS